MVIVWVVVASLTVSLVIAVGGVVGGVCLYESWFLRKYTGGKVPAGVRSPSPH